MRRLVAVVAAMELSRSKRPAMRAFGRGIVATQSAQIRLMEGWLADWYPDEPTEATYERSTAPSSRT